MFHSVVSFYVVYKQATKSLVLVMYYPLSFYDFSYQHVYF